MAHRTMKHLAAALLCAALLPSVANAQDSLKANVGQLGNLATSVAEVGLRAGIFKSTA